MKIKAFIIFTLIFTVAFEGFSQNTKFSFPNTVAGKHATAFWKLVNSKDKQTTRAFIENQMLPKKGVSVEERIGSFENIRQILSGSKLYKIIKHNDSEISFAAKSRNGRIEKIKIILATDKNGLIEGIFVQDITEDELNDELKEPNTRVLSESEIAPTVDDYLKDLAKKDDFSGVVLIAKNGQPIYKKAFGYASIDYQVPNKVDTKFNLGSINKTFTKFAIGMLADEGKLSFDDKLGKFFPDYPNKDAKEKVTVKHLLTMSSGVGNLFNSKFFNSSRRQYRTLESYLPIFASDPLLFEPGTSRQYSNSGYILLGLIIEKASGQNYFDFVSERIFQPIGMKNTAYYEADVPVPNRATGYTLYGVKDKTSKKRMSNSLLKSIRGNSAGGGFSTAEDMLKFANALENGNFKIPKSILKLDPSLARGFGIAGGGPGVNATLETKVVGKYTVIVLSNYDSPIAEKTTRKIRHWLGSN